MTRHSTLGYHDSKQPYWFLRGSHTTRQNHLVGCKASSAEPPKILLFGFKVFLTMQPLTHQAHALLTRDIYLEHLEYQQEILWQPEVNP